jgi:hypothetical protein
MNAGKNSQKGEAATRLFHALIGDRLSDKYKAIESLNATPDQFDLTILRTLVMNAIENDYYVGKEQESDDKEFANVRSWLLTTLSRISVGDEKVTTLAAAHVDKKYETFEWARYWSLEGLITSNNPKAELVAKRRCLYGERPPRVFTCYCISRITERCTVR